jgi:hypothetical protein
METARQMRELAQHVDQIHAFMRQRGLSLGDLTEIGGEDLRSSNSRRVEKARRIERCWALMAQIGVKCDELQERDIPAVVPKPDFSTRRRRHSTVARQAIDTTGDLELTPREVNLSNINDLTISGPVGDPEIKSANIAGGAP